MSSWCSFTELLASVGGAPPASSVRCVYPEEQRHATAVTTTYSFAAEDLEYDNNAPQPHVQSVSDGVEGETSSLEGCEEAETDGYSSDSESGADGSEDENRHNYSAPGDQSDKEYVDTTACMGRPVCNVGSAAADANWESFIGVDKASEDPDGEDDSAGDRCHRDYDNGNYDGMRGNNTPAPGSYERRKRHPRGAVLPDFRPTRSMGAVETALRAATTRVTEHIFQPMEGMSFDSDAEAFEFYNLYSWEVGFGIRRCSSRTRPNSTYVTMVEFECSNGGYNPRCKSQSQRCRCKARMKLLRTEDHGFYVKSFQESHNHQLSEGRGEKMQWKSHRTIDKPTRTWSNI